MGRLFPSEMRTPRASANLCLLVDNQFQCVNRLTPAVVAAVQPVGKGLHGRWRGAQRQGTPHARCQIQAARRLAVHPATACTRGRSAHYIGMLWEGHGVATKHASADLASNQNGILVRRSVAELQCVFANSCRPFSWEACTGLLPVALAAAGHAVVPLHH